MLKTMLTTVDNPHDPFDDYGAWYVWDAMSGYHTPSFLARVLVDSPNLSDKEEEEAIEHAIDEIVQENVLGVYRKVQREVEDEFLT